MKVREDMFTVRTYECQVDGNIKIVSLMQYLQEVAALHAEQLGLGYHRLNEINSYWVLSNLRIEIARIPRWNNEVAIKTWPSGFTRLMATREFVGKDQCNGELFRASSEWMVLDKEKNRPKNLFHLDLGLPKTGPKAIPGKLNRLEPQSDYSEVERVHVPYSSIDLNGHVNNTEYVRWGIDVLRRAFKFKGNVRCVHTTYLCEIHEGDELELLVSSGTGGRFSVLGRKSGGKSNVYVMDIVH
ncbi:MAG: acyl-[acyl-carrier-protein] thioesterase [Sedimentisphaerales bacterium]